MVTDNAAQLDFEVAEFEARHRRVPLPMSRMHLDLLLLLQPVNINWLGRLPHQKLRSVPMPVLSG